MTIDPRQLRDAFGAFLTGVTVVTTHDAEGKPIGFTANSFTSVSLDPPLLLVCLAKTSRNFRAMTSAGTFAVNILSEEQKDVSNTFARPVEDRFATVSWAPGPHGSPVLEGVAAWFDCSLHQVVDAGDHVILLGQVEAFGNAGTAGLGYARGSYFSPTLADKALLAGQDLPQVVGAVAERHGFVLLRTEDDGSLSLPSVQLKAGESVEVLERALEDMTGGAARTGMLYSVFEDTKARCQHVVYRANVETGDLASDYFYPVEDLPMDRVKDAATRDILRRYAAERTLGNFGLYVGNQERGRVHALAGKGDA
jgi:flavin reductase (DIM6/NTAB) family NADH-FMN oxidoreductase RutF/ADP-ribose pyrophosphatase YjhB (NUDIX family)